MAGIVLLTINSKWIHPSLALRLLKANLGALESRCEIIELNPRQSPEEQLAILQRAAPLILGVSVSIWNHKATLALLRAFLAARGASIRPVIVLGGPEVTHLDEDSELFTCADFVIRGEGEQVFAELCENILRGEVSPPLQTCGFPLPPLFPGRFINAEAMNFSSLKSAYRLYTREDLAHKLIYVEASRGCPFHCAFCQSAVSGGDAAAKTREFPLEAFLADMDDLLKRLFAARENGAGRTLKFLDRSFNANVPRALAILDFFLARLPAGAEPGTAGRFQVHFEMVPFIFPPELVAALARFPPGTLRLEIGVQSLNPRVCALISRPADPEKELETLRLLRARTNAVIHADLIAGLPGEDLASFAAGFDRLWTALTADNASAPFEIQLGILKGLPATPVRALAGDHGLRFAPDPPYEVTETASLTARDINRLANFARFWERTVNRPAFSDLLPRIAPPGQPVFWRFLEIADALHARFGRNWGIDQRELRFALIDS